MKNTIIHGITFLIITTLLSPALKSQSYDMDDLCDDSLFPFVPLSEYRDTQIETRLLNQLNRNKNWKRLISHKKMAVGLVDLQDAENIKFSCINCDHMMYAASLPKIAILLSAMHAFEDGTLKETGDILNDLQLMISRSDNQASTRMIDRLTFEKIESVLTNPEYCLYDEELGGGLWVGKRYASQGKRNPEPLKGLSHAATVRQICRFYYLMARGELVNKKRSDQMLEIMVDPTLHHKFVNTLDQIAPKARVYRKSGSWKTFHSDSVLVWGPDGRQYILTAMVDDPSGERIMRQLPREIEFLLNSIQKDRRLGLTLNISNP